MNIKPPSQPNPAPIPFGDNLMLSLLMVVSLALLGFGITVAWMFGTGRWRSAKSAKTPVLPAGNWMQGAAYMSVSPSANQPGQTIAPIMPPSAEVAPSRRTAPLPDSSEQEHPLNNKRWLGLVEDSVDLFDELDSLLPKLDAPRQEIASHVKYRLEEILVRSGVESISSDRTFDVRRHRLERPGSRVAPDTPLAEVVSPGFAVDRLVLRPARVRVVGVPLEEVQPSD